jgi:radical SAM protein (TIGR01212 family)
VNHRALSTRMWQSYQTYLARRLPGEGKIWKIPLDAGMSCPNLDGTKGKGGCAYCDARSFSPVAGQHRKSFADQALPMIERLQAKGIQRFLSYLQPASNSHAPVADLERIYREALALPGCEGLIIGTRPDCLEPEKLDLIEALAQDLYVCVEIGLQSAQDRTLKRIGRGHSRADFAHTAELCQNRAFDFGCHLILGLPGETLEDWRETASFVAQFAPHTLKIHPMHIVRGTRVEAWWRSGHLQTLSLPEFAEGVAEVIARQAPDTAIERFHGGGLADWHVAPDWTNHRAEIETALLECMEARDWHQGCLWSATGAAP